MRGDVYWNDTEQQPAQRRAARRGGAHEDGTRGFTLIELMISMALFGLIAAGAMALVMAGARSQAHSSRVDVAQSSLRAGIDFITRDVMMPSAGASTGQITLGAGVVNAVNSRPPTTSATAPDLPTDTLDLYLVDGTVAAEVGRRRHQRRDLAGGHLRADTTGRATVLDGASPISNVQVCDLRPRPSCR